MSLDIIFKKTGENFNITHNLATMAKKCKINNNNVVDRITLYDLLWNGEKKSYDTDDLIKYLPNAIRELYTRSEYYDKFDARALYGNDWGLREHLIKFCEDLLIYAIKHPNEMFEVSK